MQHKSHEERSCKRSEKSIYKSRRKKHLTQIPKRKMKLSKKEERKRDKKNWKLVSPFSFSNTVAFQERETRPVGYIYICIYILKSWISSSKTATFAACHSTWSWAKGAAKQAAARTQTNVACCLVNFFTYFFSGFLRRVSKYLKIAFGWKGRSISSNSRYAVGVDDISNFADLWPQLWQSKRSTLQTGWLGLAPASKSHDLPEPALMAFY